MPSPNNFSPWRLEWSDALSMGIPAIDVEHQHFIQLINELNEAIIARMGREEIKIRMQAITDDAVAHFFHEEALFREWGYPAAEEHAQKHAQIVHFLRKIMAGFERDGTEYELVEGGLKVKQTLIDHLLSEDVKYRDYLRASGARLKGEHKTAG